MQERIERFFTEVHASFAFLEHEYGLRSPQDVDNNGQDIRDLQVEVLYVGQKVAVKVFWLLANAQLDIGFIELQKPYALPHQPVSFVGEYPDHVRGIWLSTYLEKLGHSDSIDIVLKHFTIHKGREYRHRERIIDAGTQSIVEGLARATRTYAGAILLGDTSMFSTVLQFAHRR